MQSPQRPVSGRPRSAQVDDAILRAALALFVEGGLAAVTFEGVAIEGGVSRTAIYRRWSSAEELVAAALARLREQAEASFSDWSTRSMEEVIAWFIENVPRQMCDVFYRKLTRQVLALSDTSIIKLTYSREILQPRRRVFSAMIERARSDGDLASGADPDLLQDMLSGALLYRMLLGDGSDSETEIRTYIVALLRSLRLLPHAANASA